MWREITRGMTELVWTCTNENDGYIGRRMLRMELPEKGKQGRHKMWFMDAVREYLAVAKVTEEDAEGRTEWRRKIRCGDH